MTLDDPQYKKGLRDGKCNYFKRLSLKMPREDDMRISNGRLLDNFHRLNDDKKIDFFMPISTNVG